MQPQILDFLVVPPLLGDNTTRLVNLQDLHVFLCEYCRRPGVKKQEYQYANWLKVLQVCANCNKVKYCSTNCQRKDWKKHRFLCKSVNKNFVVQEQNTINIEPLAPTMSYHSSDFDNDEFIDTEMVAFNSGHPVCLD